MEIKIHNSLSGDLAEIIADEVIIRIVQDALDLLGEVDGQDSKLIIINIEISFQIFQFEYRPCRKILQKYVNYGFRISIVGDFQKCPRRSLEAFII